MLVFTTREKNYDSARLFVNMDSVFLNLNWRKKVLKNRVMLSKFESCNSFVSVTLW